VGQKTDGWGKGWREKERIASSLRSSQLHFQDKPPEGMRASLGGKEKQRRAGYGVEIGNPWLPNQVGNDR
jgi:hypothetical protein